MSSTIEPMFAGMIGGWEVIAILAALLMIPAMAIVAGLLVFFIVRKSSGHNSANPGGGASFAPPAHQGPPLQNPLQPANRNRAPWILLGTLAVVLVTILLVVFLRTQAQSRNDLSPGISLVSLFLALMLVGLLVTLVVSIFVRLVTTANRSTPGALAPIPPTIPIQPSARECPKCGAILKSDVPEGLCPACLLQHGIATEGGAPPGTPAFTPPPLPELAKLFPQLEILELIGQGGMGAVYKARQPSLDRFVALKILAPRSGSDLDFAGRFSREARALAKLSHPNIVNVYDYGTVGQASSPSSADKSTAIPETGAMPVLHYFLMEYVDGPNLRQVEQAGKLSPREALEIIPQICGALQFAHDEGIVHRDIKPENVLLDKKGRVKIADFGLAKILGQEADFRLTGARDVMGTPHYMAPEQVEKPQEVDHRADIYSLGVVFYEMLTGELPLGKFDPPSHKVQVDVRVDEVVLRSLANNPDRRYQHVSEVKTELDAIAQTPTSRSAQIRTTQGNQCLDYRSRFSLFGLPLLHVAAGVDSETGKMRVAKGIIAVGSRAQGVVAIGGFAMGGIAIGGGAIGILAFGGMAFGVFSFGGLAIALVLALGGGAIAPIALGGGAVGYFTFAGGGVGTHVLAANVHDPLAQRFFGSWGRAWIMSIPIVSMVVTIVAMVAGLGAFLWAWYVEKTSDSSAIPRAIRDWLAVMDRGDYARSWELAAPYFQSTIKKEDWVGKGQSIRRPLGAVHSRELSGMHFTEGTRVQAKFKAVFDNLSAAIETVTFTRQAEGSWKAIGYLIRPGSGRGWLSWAFCIVVAGGISIMCLASVFIWQRNQNTPALTADANNSGGISDSEKNDAIEAPREKLSAPKTITLVRATNQWIDVTNRTQTVTVWTDSYLEPGETVSALVKRGTNELVQTIGRKFVNWRPDHTGTSSALTWYFGGVMEKKFGESEAQSALDQLRTNFTDRPTILAPGQPRELFAVTNNAGESLVGYIEFKRDLPPPVVPGTKIEGIIHIRHFFGAPTSPNIGYVAKLPPGYSIRATANSGTADTHSPGGPYEYMSSWSNWPRPVRPPAFSPPGQLAPPYAPPRVDSAQDYMAKMKSLEQQLQDLQDQGPISVVLGQPKLIFSITNGPDDVFQGFLELVGPGMDTQKQSTGAQAPQIVVPLQLPPPTIMSPVPAPLPPGGIIRPLRTLPSRQTKSAITPEEQIALIESQRAKAIRAQDPIARYLPPSGLSTSTNSTNGASPAKINPATGMPAPGTNAP